MLGADGELEGRGRGGAALGEVGGHFAGVVEFVGDGAGGGVDDGGVEGVGGVDGGEGGEEFGVFGWGGHGGGVQ